MATKFETPDFAKAFDAYLKAVPADFNQVAQETATFWGRLGAIGLKAAQQNNELAYAWTQDALKKATVLTKPQTKPEEYFKLASDLVTEQVQNAPERIGKFVEVAKNAQLESSELVMESSKDLREKLVKSAEKVAKSTQKAA